MAKWTLEEHLTFDIAFVLKKITIPGFRKAVTEEHRIAIAKTILDHLKLCRWEFSKPSEPASGRALSASRLAKERKTESSIAS